MRDRRGPPVLPESQIRPCDALPALAVSRTDLLVPPVLEDSRRAQSLASWGTVAHSGRRHPLRHLCIQGERADHLRRRPPHASRAVPINRRHRPASSRHYGAMPGLLHLRPAAAVRTATAAIWAVTGAETAAFLGSDSVVAPPGSPAVCLENIEDCRITLIVQD